MWQVLVYNAKIGQWYVMFSHPLKAEAERAESIYRANDLDLKGTEDTYALINNPEIG